MEQKLRNQLWIKGSFIFIILLLIVVPTLFISFLSKINSNPKELSECDSKILVFQKATISLAKVIFNQNGHRLEPNAEKLFNKIISSIPEKNNNDLNKNSNGQYEKITDFINYINEQVLDSSSITIDSQVLLKADSLFFKKIPSIK